MTFPSDEFIGEVALVRRLTDEAQRKYWTRTAADPRRSVGERLVATLQLERLESAPSSRSGPMRTLNLEISLPDVFSNAPAGHDPQSASLREQSPEGLPVYREAHRWQP